MSVDSVSGPSLSIAQKGADSKDTCIQFHTVLGRVIDYLVKVTDEASRGWMPSEEPAMMDVHLVEMAVDQLIKMIDRSVQALDLLLAYPSMTVITSSQVSAWTAGIIEILMRSILNPLSKIRHSIWQLATTICTKSDVAADAFYKWAVKNRAQADCVSMYCGEFYVLIEQYVQANFQHPTPEQVKSTLPSLQEIVY